jgi:anti-anti-sigma factor
LNVHSEKHGEIDVLRPAGRIDSATAGTLDRAINAAFEGGGRCMVLDFSQIEYISSAGLRSTLIAGKRMRAVPGGRLVLCSLGPQVREIFEISGFNAIFAICADFEAALAACTPGPAAA